MRGINMGRWLSQIDAIQEKDPENFPGIDKHIRYATVSGTMRVRY
jgi:hypothetical protein